LKGGNARWRIHAVFFRAARKGAGGAKKNNVQISKFERAGRQKFIFPTPLFLFACPPEILLSLLGQCDVLN